MTPMKPLILTMIFASSAAAAPPAPGDVDIAAPDGTNLKAAYYAAARPGPAVLLAADTIDAQFRAALHQAAEQKLAKLRAEAQPAASLPPAYPRAGAVKIFENDRVQVWNIAWLKGQPSPLHRHLYDLVGVYYEPGDRMIISPAGTKRPVSTKAWDLAFQLSGVTHIEEGVSDAPLRAVFVEMKKAGAYGTDAHGGAPPFSGEGGMQRLDNNRVTVWEFLQPPPARLHRHAHDAVIVTLGGQSPAVTWLERGTEHSDEGTHAVRTYVFEIK